MTYIEWLRTHQATLQPKIDASLREYQVQGVGSGYIDLIVRPEEANDLIDTLTQENVVVEAISWWCHCTEDSERVLGCPHGMGGPYSQYYAGWFSEMDERAPVRGLIADPAAIRVDHLPEDVLTINTHAKELLVDTQARDWFTPCLWPGLWLCVPNEWERFT